MNLKNLTSGIVLAILVFTLASCGGKPANAERKTSPGESARVEVSIGGMSCAGCEQTIQTNLGKLDGVKSVKASFYIGNAIIEYYPEMVDSIKMKDAIIGSGYTVKKFSSVQPQEISK